MICPIFNWFARPGVKPALVDFSRASVATYVDALGIIRTAPAGVLRDNYDMATAEYLGKLIEESRTNALAYSRDLTQASKWTSSNMTVTRDQVGADGVAARACKLLAAAANATVSQAVTAASAQQCLALRIKRLSGSGPVSISLDGGTSWTDITAQLSASAWTRPVLVQTLANPTVSIKVATSGNAVIVDYLQLEAGPFPTSDIEVSGTSPVVRAADLVTLTLANLKDPMGNALFSGGEGTLYVHGGVNAVGATSQWPILAALYSDATHYAGIYLSDPSANDPLVANVIDGTSQAQLTLLAATSAAQQVKSALSFKVNQFTGYAKGGSEQTDSLGTVPAMTTLGFGVLVNTYRLNGHLRHVALFNRALTATELQALAG